MTTPKLEEIARAIDPEAWKHVEYPTFDGPMWQGMGRAASLERARAVLTELLEPDERTLIVGGAMIPPPRRMG